MSEERDQAERAVLGGMLLAESAIEMATDALRGSDDFYRTTHGAIYATITAMWAAGKPVDPVTVSGELLKTGDLARVGGAPYLHTLVTSVPTAANAGHYARIVAEHAQRRRITEASARLAHVATIDDPAARAERLAAVVAELDTVVAGPSSADTDSWSAVDLGPYIRGEVNRPEPTIGITRSDGLRLIYPGKEHSVIGEMESGKSWFCLASAAAEISLGRHVVYIHFEESDPSDTVERLQALGVPDDSIVKLFRFVGPERPVTPAAIARLVDPAPSLVVLDGVNEAMSLHGLAIREEDGAAAFRRLLVKPFTTVGAATLSNDHVVKDPDRRGRGPLGSIHKGNALSGSLIVLENADPFGRGQRGRSHVYVTKDRPGHLRKHGQTTKTPGRTHMGQMVVDDTRTWVNYLDLAFLAPSETEAEDAGGGELVETVASVLAEQPGREVASERALLAALRAAGHQSRNTAVRDAIDDLIAAGRAVETYGKRGAKGYRLTASQDQEQEPSATASRTASRTASP